jgi:hypothetical protein
MKKIITVVLVALSVTSFAQGKHKQIPDANKSFVTPFQFYAIDTAKAYKLGIYATVDNNVDAPSGVLIIKYGLFGANDMPLKGGEGFYQCAGACYTAYDGNDNNSAFMILTDSVIHKALK